MADAGDEGDALRANAGESPRPFPESANGGMESLTDEEDFLNKTPTGDVNPEDLQEERAEREGDVETRSHEPPSGLFGDERDEIELGGTEREVSREEARRLKKEKKKRKKEKKEKKEKKKKRKRDQEGDDGEAEREKARLGGQNSGFLDDDDETLGGFIERDPEAAIHEAEDERIHVQGGINSDNDRSDIEDYGEHEGTHRPLTEFDKTLERMRQRKRRAAAESRGGRLTKRAKSSPFHGCTISSEADQSAEGFN